MRKIRWGILSTAKIGIGDVIPAIQQSEYGEVIAIASRDLTRARIAAMRLGIERAYGSYEELLADPEVEVIYNPLPNNLHVLFALKALQAGKHVLCEKPVALTTSEAETLLSESKKNPRLKVMEAFMYKFHPQWQRVFGLIRDGRIGAVRMIQSFFSYYNSEPNDIRNSPQMGGGALLDIGCYTISLSRKIYGCEPRRVVGIMKYDPNFQIDWIASGILDFNDGLATFTCSMQLQPYQRVNILGTEGNLEIEIPFNLSKDISTRIAIYCGYRNEQIVVDAYDQYTLQGDAFSYAILNDLPVPIPLEDSVANMRVIEAIKSSAEKACWI